MRVLCVKPTPSGHNNVYLVETRTGRTPLKSLTNLSQNKTADSTILDFAVNDITGGVSAAWFESPMKSNPNTVSNVHLGGGPVITYCYRC